MTESSPRSFSLTEVVAVTLTGLAGGMGLGYLIGRPKAGPEPSGRMAIPPPEPTRANPYVPKKSGPRPKYWRIVIKSPIAYFRYIEDLLTPDLAQEAVQQVMASEKTLGTTLVFEMVDGRDHYRDVYYLTTTGWQNEKTLSIDERVWYDTGAATRGKPFIPTPHAKGPWGEIYGDFAEEAGKIHAYPVSTATTYPTRGGVGTRPQASPL